MRAFIFLTIFTLPAFSSVNFIELRCDSGTNWDGIIIKSEIQFNFVSRKFTYKSEVGRNDIEYLKPIGGQIFHPELPQSSFCVSEEYSERNLKNNIGFFTLSQNLRRLHVGDKVRLKYFRAFDDCHLIQLVGHFQPYSDQYCQVTKLYN